ncbi:hypothetical protein KIN20_005394 [Parelaphostrongylus tenuis]|uniref:Uncharacterized protein n=1 Tax=Parelaphostrongylus tenuis TaxID=148309 RepID=A0AAD5QK17_PARTN|nr:hypothetical protein KIN20_005394 [Parelaphostrongylus tenuis]
MKLTKLEEKAQQTNLLLDAGFNASMPELEGKPRSGLSTKFNNKDSIDASEDEPSSSARKLAVELDIPHTESRKS